MTLKVKCVVPNGCFSRAQLEELAKALTVDTSSSSSGVGVSGSNGSIRQVYYGKNAPFDICTPWQKVNDCGEPIGRVKSFIGGKWQ